MDKDSHNPRLAEVMRPGATQCTVGPNTTNRMVPDSALAKVSYDIGNLYWPLHQKLEDLFHCPGSVHALRSTPFLEASWADHASPQGAKPHFRYRGVYQDYIGILMKGFM